MFEELNELAEIKKTTEDLKIVNKENNHGVHKQFLTNLKGILPSCATPVIVSDAGFRAPWFMAVRQLGWHFVGRLRNKNLAYMEEQQ